MTDQNNIQNPWDSSPAQFPLPGIREEIFLQKAEPFLKEKYGNHVIYMSPSCSMCADKDRILMPFPDSALSTEQKNDLYKDWLSFVPKKQQA